MSHNLDLAVYLNAGIRGLVKDALRTAKRNPRELAFLLRLAASARRAERSRADHRRAGEQIPPFLIASVTQACTLRCAGCYSHANSGCAGGQDDALADTEWGRIFNEAQKAGIPIALLAGGEPLLRRGVLEQASARRGMLFPVFTNGTMLDDAYLSLFDRRRNLVPMLSLEGGAAATDARRGAGVHGHVMAAAKALGRRGILYGVSITATRKNLAAVTELSFLRELWGLGCRAAVYVEYVPVDEATAGLAPDEEERRLLGERIAALRAALGMIVISFPGDEESLGGCLAAGRGFFHINARGSAEPCPFSPFSDTSLRAVSLREALRSPLFGRLREQGLLEGGHAGGCTLFAHKDQVAQLAGE